MVPLDYESLRIIWWVLLGTLLIGFALFDGADLGIGALLPFVARTDGERRLLVNLVGPTWEGSQVWLILGGGAVFAAWPDLYAVSFSGFYLAMLALLVALVLRPVGFKYRGKVAAPLWRGIWDGALCIGGAVPAVIFGVAVGNALTGVPFTFDADLRPHYAGTVFGLLTPFPLLCGLLSLGMCAAHGAALVALRTRGPTAERARDYGSCAALATAALFALGGLWVAFGLDGYVVSGVQHAAGPSNPLGKVVLIRTGAWLTGYEARPWTAAVPALGLGGALLAARALLRDRPRPAMVGSGSAIVGIVATAGLSLFPFLLPSSLDPRASLTVWDASSSPLTLWTMLVATAVFLPVVLAYTAWAYRVMRGPVTAEVIARNPNAY